MKRAMRVIRLTQVHDYPGEFHVATKRQIYKHMKNESLSQALTFFRDKLKEFAHGHKITEDDFVNIEAGEITKSTAGLSNRIVEVIAEREGKAFVEIRNEINEFYLKNTH